MANEERDAYIEQVEKEVDPADVRLGLVCGRGPRFYRVGGGPEHDTRYRGADARSAGGGRASILCVCVCVCCLFLFFIDLDFWILGFFILLPKMAPHSSEVY